MWIRVLVDCKCVLTREVVELIQCLHNDGNEGQVQLSNVGSDLGIPIARVCIVAAQQGVNSANSLFMKEENPAGKKKLRLTIHMFTVRQFQNSTFLGHNLNSG